MPSVYYSAFETGDEGCTVMRKAVKQDQACHIRTQQTLTAEPPALRGNTGAAGSPAIFSNYLTPRGRASKNSVEKSKHHFSLRREKIGWGARARVSLIMLRSRATAIA